MAVNIGDVLKITVQGHTGGAGIYENVFHCIWNAPDDYAESSAMVAILAWVDAYTSYLDDIVCTNTTFELIKCYNETADLPVGEAVPTHSVGTIATDPLPSGVAALVTLYTGFKRTVGKKFIAGLPEAATTLGEWGGATLGALALIAEFWIGPQAPIVGVSFTMCTYKKLGHLAHAIYTGVIRAVPGYQRRRKAGVGA